jgi:hypothetical protein
MKSHAGSRKGARVGVRLSAEEQVEIAQAAKARGYASPSAFIRAAIQNEINGRAELTGTEERIAGSFERVCREIFRVGRGQQALFALLDALTKTVLTCIPEPPGEAKPQAVARGKERYDRLIKSAGRAMVGEARAAMQDLVGNGAEG